MIRVDHNVETGEVLEIELSAKEVAELEKGYAESLKTEEATKAELAKKAEDKAALLAKLGISDEEAKLLLS